MSSTTAPTTGPTGPEPNSTIVYPKVPAGEEDPRIRINKMISILDAEIREVAEGTRSSISKGFVHEIFTARLLSDKSAFDHGGQISRPLTAAEIAKKTFKGHEQQIFVPMAGGKFREIDFVYETMEGKDKKTKVINIVEAKNTKSPEHAQMEYNARLARKIGGRLVYALPENHKNQEGAYRKDYRALPDGLGENEDLLHFIYVPWTIESMYDKGSTVPKYLRNLLTDKDMEDEGEDGNGETADWW